MLFRGFVVEVVGVEFFVSFDAVDHTSQSERLVVAESRHGQMVFGVDEDLKGFFNAR